MLTRPKRSRLLPGEKTKMSRKNGALRNRPGKGSAYREKKKKKKKGDATVNDNQGAETWGADHWQKRGQGKCRGKRESKKEKGLGGAKISPARKAKTTMQKKKMRGEKQKKLYLRHSW